MPRSDLPVLIAGGGPVGVITALALARRGVPVKVFEAAEAVNDAPRASTLHPATLEMLADLDMLDEVVERGLVARTFQFWDRPASSLVAEFDHAVLKDDTPYPFVVQCEQHKVAKMGIERLRSLGVEYRFNAPVTEVEQDGDAVKITIQTDQGVETVAVGSFLVGADGGRSTVRKSLAIPFEGYTWPERFLVITTPFDFHDRYGVAFRSYFSDPDEWVNLFKVAGDDGLGRWRAVFPATPGQSEADVLGDDAIEARLQKFFPKPGRYEILHRNIYNVHQRVAARFRERRVFLAGDSAHVNNPIGGLGLNCGIHDAMFLAQLIAAARDGADDGELDKYDAIRRPTNIDYVQQQTITNKKRLEEKDPAARAASFATLRAMAADPAAQRKFLMRTSLLESVRTRPARSTPVDLVPDPAS
jgi:3-(3-hydroxy-phenyl)propionate hydroxylase